MNNNNFIEYYAIQKGNNEQYNHSNITTNSNRRKVKVEEDYNNISKNPKKNIENFNKRFNTPLTYRYQNQSYDNKINNTTTFARGPLDMNPNINPNSNQFQYQYQEKTQSENERDNDASYYKNLYMQTKNNLNKEKQKNEENSIRISELTKENNMLKEKINGLTTQLDRVINLVEISNNQNKKNMNIKQNEINKLNNQIDSLVKNKNLNEIKNREEKESLTNTIKQLNTDNQNRHLTIKNYQNQIEQINQVSNNEINNLKEQIISLNKNLTLCINEKNINAQKNKEIIAELNKKIAENMEYAKKYEIKNLENLKLIKELNEQKNNYNEIKLKNASIELEYDTLKNMEKNYNKLLGQLDFVQSEKNQILKKFEVTTKIISDLKVKLNNTIEELNKFNNENQILKKELKLI